jgi:hypothetical protein
MPMRTTISPLAGWPRTRARNDRHGKLIFEITPRVLTPGRAKLADRVHSCLAALWLIRCIFAFFNFPVLGLREFLQTAALYAIGHVVLRVVVEATLRTKTEIIMTNEVLSVRHWWNRREYDRALIKGFSLLHHDEAEAERFNQEFEKAKEAQQGNVIQPTPYFMRSFHVVASFAGQRLDLLSVYGQKEAAAIAARLQLCHLLLDEDAGIKGRSGVAAKPEREWQGAPGGLRHE